ncbi:MAG: 2,3,4,5-tetrahydropyridine-2,6-dicarboxylate N-succinyltransferase [Bdellovibrio sp.]
MNAAQIESLEAKLKAHGSLTPSEKADLLAVIEALDTGKIRVAERQSSGAWTTNAWVKQAILMYFRVMQMNPIQAGDLQFFDKVPLKTWSAQTGVRVVPPAVARKGSFIEPGAILMPSYVNLGAYVGAGTMVDTWATVGSCAQIGKNVHLSGGVGIGGVLEPIQASPVIVEDDVFIGSRSIVVEGAYIQEGAVLGAGVTITASTKIIDVSGPIEQIFQGVVPKNSVVIPGTYQKNFAAGTYGVNCALIIGTRKESTDKKTSLTQALREHSVSV